MQEVSTLSIALLFAVLASTTTFAQTFTPGVSGGGQNSTAANWKSVELPMDAVAGLDRTPLTVSTPGLTFKVLGTTVISGGQALKLSLNVQRASGDHSGHTNFTLQDVAGHPLTFGLPVS